MRFYLVQFEKGYVVLLVLSALLVILLIDGVDLVVNNKIFWKKNVVGIVLQWFWVVSVLLLIGFTTNSFHYFSRQVLFSWFFITPVVLVTTHWLLRLCLHRWLFVDGSVVSNAIIIGLNRVSCKLAYEFKQNPLMGIACMGFFDDRQSERSSQNLQQPETLLGNIVSAVEFVKTHNVQHIYIALPMTAKPRILALLDELRDTTASVYFVPDIIFSFDLIQANISTINGIPIVAVCESPLVGINSTIKSISDVALSLLILLLTAPLMLLIAIGVKLSSPGPVLFKQHRYGLDGKEIVIYKFRSMTVMENGEQVNQATRSDPRITRFGGFLRRTSLDELPQFINVLQGRMSIVGPRPHAVSHNEIYRGLIKGYMIRHKVKPGITGWAQVKGFRGETETVEKMQSRINFDLDYMRNWSLFLDLLIIFKTIGIVINDKNAY